MTSSTTLTFAIFGALIFAGLVFARTSVPDCDPCRRWISNCATHKPLAQCQAESVQQGCRP